MRINDRGPFVGGRVIDLSRAAASSLGINGLGRVEDRRARPRLRTGCSDGIGARRLGLPRPPSTGAMTPAQFRGKLRQAVAAITRMSE